MNPRFGKKQKTDLKVIIKTNTLYHGSDSIIQLNYKDFKKFAQQVTKRHKHFSNKKSYIHFTHLSPDVSFLLVKK